MHACAGVPYVRAVHDATHAPSAASEVCASARALRQDEKKKYLKQAIEKLDQALVLNADSRTHEGELAVFALGNALYFEFFLEKDNAKAEQSLKNAKKKFEDAIKKEPSNMSYRQMIEQLETAHEQRKAHIPQEPAPYCL
jgi:hypothetical protein